MLLAPNQKLIGHIMQAFSRCPHQTAHQLQQQIALVYPHSSLRGIYKELGRLQEAEVLIKVKDSYRLSLTWVLDLMRFSEGLYQQCLEEQAVSGTLPADGDRNTWTFSDLQRLDNFWLQLIFALFEHSGARIMFESVPHFWFHLLHYEKELQVIRALRTAGNKIYLSISSDTYLSRLAESYLDQSVYECSFSAGLFDPGAAPYLCVIDNYVLTARLDRKTTERLQHLFAAVHSRKDFDIRMINNALRQSCKASLKLENNRKKARALDKKFGDFFGASPHQTGA